MTESPHHAISSMGRVYSLPRNVRCAFGGVRWCSGGVLNPSVNRGGYKIVSIARRQHRLVHRLVALAFIPNPSGKETVNHIDGNKLNNRKENLEWATNSENVSHAHATGLCDNRKAIECLNTGKIYESLDDACKEYGLAKGNLSSHLKGIQGTWGGHVWRYVEFPSRGD